MLVIALVAVALTSGAASAAMKLTTSERELVRAVNATRTAHGVAPLRVDDALTRAARFHSRQQLAAGRLEHGDFLSRLRRFDAHGGALGENLAWGSGSYGRAAAIVRAWLNSPPHRANLLSRVFRRVGLGVAHGTFAGYSGASVVTADFAGG